MKKVKKEKKPSLPCKWKSRKFLLTVLFALIVTIMMLADKIAVSEGLQLLVANFGLYSIGNGLTKRKGG